jgi:hypothetical protein
MERSSADRRLDIRFSFGAAYSLQSSSADV